MKIFSSKNSYLRNNITIFCFVLLFIGFLFGTYFYKNANTYVIDLFDKLFYQTSEEYIEYQYWYLTISFLYFFFSFLASTSYLGVLCNSFIIFSKGIQVSFSLCKLFHSGITFEIFILHILPQIVIEIFIIYIVSYLTLRLSLNTFSVCFVNHETFRAIRIINYMLDYIIFLLVLFVCAILFRVYLL